MLTYIALHNHDIHEYLSQQAMCSLEEFPSLPEGNSVPLCVMEGRVQSSPPDFANVHIYTSLVSTHPHIEISRDMLHPTVSHEDPNRIFLPVTDTLWKRMQIAWYEKGFVDMLQVAAVQREGEGLQVVHFLAKQVLFLLNFTSYVYKVLPVFKVKESGEELAAKMSQNSDYRNNSVRCLSWHPHCTKLAVAVLDDSIRVFSATSQLTPLLKCRTQRFVSSLAWRPLSASELAVGCMSGVLIWNVDPNSVITRPSTSSTLLLTRPNHTFITSVCWSPQGDLLVSGSACDNTMYVWDVALEKGVPLRRVGGGGISLVTWSPNSMKVFAATTNIVFRVWDTMKWEPDMWSVISGHVVSACWSPCGSTVLFATSTEPVVYALMFGAVGSVFATEDKRSAVAVIDVTAIELETGERAGGEICSMVWDKNGRYLAIMFKECDIVAVFMTFIKTKIHVTPCCFVRGMQGESPAVICFQENFKEGANLTIAWSSGRVQYFPILYTELTPDQDGLSTTMPSFQLTSPRANISDVSAFSPFTSP